MLPKRFEEPANFKWDKFISDSSHTKIRTGFAQPAGTPKGTVVHVPGFREPIEKCFEIVRDYTDRGFAVYVMDWPGQGGSERFLPDAPQKMHCYGYDQYIATLHQFTQDIVKKSDGPLILSGHSMGGHIGLRYLKEHEGVFDAAIFTAPMCDIQTPGFSRLGAQLLAKGMKLAHRQTKYIPKGHDWDKEKDTNEAMFNRLTSDRERFSVLASIYEANEDMKMGDPTYGYILSTFNSIKILNDENYLKSIKTPILMGIAGNEQVVITAASQRAARLLPNCRRVDMPEARHEVWMEQDKFRKDIWLAEVNKFLIERLGPQTPAPKKPNTHRQPGI